MEANSNTGNSNLKFSGWSVTVAAVVIVLCHMMVRGSFATLIQGMCASTGWSTGVVSLGSSLFMVFYGIFAFLTGTYINKLGPRKTYLLHGCIMAAGLFLCSYSTEPWQYWLFYGVIAGIGSGAFWAPVTSMVRQWFIDKLGIAMGLTTAAAGAAMCLGPIVSMNLIAGQSWQTMMRVFAIILIVGIGIASQFTIMKPEDVGQKPLGFDAFMARQAAASEGAEKKAEEFYVPFKWAVKHKAFWILSILWFCSNFAEFIVFSHAIQYTTGDLGYDKMTATYIYCLIGLVFIFSAIAVGGFTDKLTAKMGDPLKARKRVLTFSYIGCAAMALWLNYGAPDRRWWQRCLGLRRVRSCLWLLLRHLHSVDCRYGRCCLWSQGNAAVLGPRLPHRHGRWRRPWSVHRRLPSRRYGQLLCRHLAGNDFLPACPGLREHRQATHS